MKVFRYFIPNYSILAMMAYSESLIVLPSVFDARNGLYLQNMEIFFKILKGYSLLTSAM